MSSCTFFFWVWKSNYIKEEQRVWYKKYLSSKRTNTTVSVLKIPQIMIGPDIKTHPLVDIFAYDAPAPKLAFDFLIDHSKIQSLLEMSAEFLHFQITQIAHIQSPPRRFFQPFPLINSKNSSNASQVSMLLGAAQTDPTHATNLLQNWLTSSRSRKMCVAISSHVYSHNTFCRLRLNDLCCTHCL